jgi:hypothetical protein
MKFNLEDVNDACKDARKDARKAQELGFDASAFI